MPFPIRLNLDFGMIADSNLVSDNTQDMNVHAIPPVSSTIYIETLEERITGVVHSIHTMHVTDNRSYFDKSFMQGHEVATTMIRVTVTEYKKKKG